MMTVVLMMVLLLMFILLKQTAIMITEDSCESGYDSVNNDEFSEWLPN